MFLPTAIDIAATAHEGQLYGDAPYIVHPTRVLGRVAAQLDGYRTLTARQRDVARSAAVLHDVLEDNPAKAEAGRWPSEVLDIVSVLTRIEDEVYFDYIQKVKTFGLFAVVIKIADVEDHLAHDPAPSLRARYAMSLSVLRSEE